jgi:hypothetical protein
MALISQNDVEKALSTLIYFLGEGFTLESFARAVMNDLDSSQNSNFLEAASLYAAYKVFQGSSEPLFRIRVSRSDETLANENMIKEYAKHNRENFDYKETEFPIR